MTEDEYLKHLNGGAGGQQFMYEQLLGAVANFGLRTAECRIGRIKELPDTPATRGMIRKVSHLVDKEFRSPASPAAAPAPRAATRPPRRK
jgi:Ribosomal protein L30p/L7e